MITKLTPCGKKLLFDDIDVQKVEPHSFYYHSCSGSFYYRDVETGKQNTVNSLLYGSSKKNAYLHISDNNGDFRSENINKISLSEYCRYRPPASGKKYKGITLSKRDRILVVTVYIYSNKTISFRLGKFSQHINEQNRMTVVAAGIYNAMCDHLGFDGYRNPVPKIELTVEQKVGLDNKYAKIKEKANNEKPL